MSTWKLLLCSLAIVAMTHPVVGADDDNKSKSAPQVVRFKADEGAAEEHANRDGIYAFYSCPDGDGYFYLSGNVGTAYFKWDGKWYWRSLTFDHWGIPFPAIFERAVIYRLDKMAGEVGYLSFQWNSSGPTANVRTSNKGVWFDLFCKANIAQRSEE